MDRTPRDPVHRPEGMVASILPTEPTGRRDVRLNRIRKTTLFEKISPNLVDCDPGDSDLSEMAS